MIKDVIESEDSVSLNCDICGGTDVTCVCPECDVCGEVGNPDCIEAHMPLKEWKESLHQMKAFLEKDARIRPYINGKILILIECDY